MIDSLYREKVLHLPGLVAVAPGLVPELVAGMCLDTTHRHDKTNLGEDSEITKSI